MPCKCTLEKRLVCGGAGVLDSTEGGVVETTVVVVLAADPVTVAVVSVLVLFHCLTLLAAVLEEGAGAFGAVAHLVVDVLLGHQNILVGSHLLYACEAVVFVVSEERAATEASVGIVVVFNGRGAYVGLSVDVEDRLACVSVRLVDMRLRDVAVQVFNRAALEGGPRESRVHQPFLVVSVRGVVGLRIACRVLPAKALGRARRQRAVSVESIGVLAVHVVALRIGLHSHYLCSPAALGVE